MIKKLYNIFINKKSIDRFNEDMLQLNQKLLEEGLHNAKIR